MNAAVWFATNNKLHTVSDFLIRSGVSVKKPVGRSRIYDRQVTLLHVAAMSGKLHRVKLLLEHGADPNAKNSRGKTVLHYAVAWDRAEIVEHLISVGADMNTRDKYSLTILHYAALKRAENSVKVLLQRGVDIEAVDSRGWNALHVAIMAKNIKVVEMLLNRRITVNMRDVLYWTPLHFAAYYCRDVQIMQLLLDNGAYVNPKTKDGCIPLYYAVKNKNSSAVKLLLSKGAKINEITDDCETPLHAACQGGLASIADILLHNGADVNVRNKMGKVALSTVKQGERQITAKIVVKHIARLEVGNAFINEGNRRDIRNSKELSRYYSRCHEELAIMKKTMVEKDCKASYYCILSQDLKTVAALVRNRDLVWAFEETDCRQRFSIYAEDLKYKFLMAKAKSKAVLSMEGLLSDILEDRLPEIAIQNIVQHLKIEDIKDHNIA